ncbi:MAG: energy transducer TonB [Undibacterium sp.]|nr:energy transducer TonB [Undibacterium sp.]
MNALVNLYAPEPIQRPSRFVAGSLIALAHLIGIYLIMINPPQFLRNMPKETVMFIVSSQTPPAPAPTPRLLKSVPPTTHVQATVPSPVLAMETVSQEAIHLTPVAVDTAAVAAPVSHAPVMVHQEVSTPKIVSAIEYLQAPQQEYPAMAKRLGEEGRVEMQVLVNEKGRAEKVDIIKSSGFPRLDEAAKLALLRALYKPYLENGRAIAIIATASINFSLRG